MAAQFDPAYEKTLIHEGGYVNDPSDPGGETYKGVSRKNWSVWRGWQNIDLAKRQPNFPANLEKDIDLQGAVKEFYLSEFWNKMYGDKLEKQAVANSIFDFAVNAGLKVSICLAQMAVSTDADGIVGDNTIKALNDCDEHQFLTSFALAKIARYTHLAQKNSALRKYMFGWVSRALETIEM